MTVNSNHLASRSQNTRLMKGAGSTLYYINYNAKMTKTVMHIYGKIPLIFSRLPWALFLNHSIISLLYLVWVRAPHWPHVRQAKFCLRVCQVVFLGDVKLDKKYKIKVFSPKFRRHMFLKTSIYQRDPMLYKVYYPKIM